MLSKDSIVRCRLQTPENEDGKRDQLCPFTTSDEVYMNGETGDTPTNETLSQRLAGMIPFELKQDRPKEAALWFKPVEQ